MWNRAEPFGSSVVQAQAPVRHGQWFGRDSDRYALLSSKRDCQTEHLAVSRANNLNELAEWAHEKYQLLP